MIGVAEASRLRRSLRGLCPCLTAGRRCGTHPPAVDDAVGIEEAHVAMELIVDDAAGVMVGLDRVGAELLPVSPELSSPSCAGSLFSLGWWRRRWW